MTFDVDAAIATLRESLPLHAKWTIHQTPLDFDFTRVQRALRTLTPDEVLGELDPEWFDLLIFGQCDYADGGGACPWLTVHRRNGTVSGLDLERDESVFLLNSSVEAFIEVFALFDLHLRNNSVLPKDIASQVKELDPSVYADSEWKMFVESLLSA